MRLLVCILNEPGKLNDVITAMVEAGIHGGTIVESYGMGKILARDIPIFAGFRHLLSGAQPYNHTILSVIENDSVLERFIALLGDILKPRPDAAPMVLFTVPVDRFHRVPAPGGGEKCD